MNEYLFAIAAAPVLVAVAAPAAAEVGTMSGVYVLPDFEIESGNAVPKTRARTWRARIDFDDLA